MNLKKTNITAEIQHRLQQTEKQHNVRIIMAIESGSRAWGFASPDSDYDVRFIYVRPKDWYLSINVEEKRDVIEYPIVDEIDLNGWDIKKALKLYNKSNPTFIEWLNSPITYINTGIFRQQAKQLIPTVNSLKAATHHYASMAKTTYQKYLNKESILLKKYFYALRPLLAIKWIETTQQTPPIEFNKLLTLVADKALLQAINQLLKQKTQSKEKYTIKPITIIQNYIQTELQRLQSLTIKPQNPTRNTEQLNQLYRQIINETR